MRAMIFGVFISIKVANLVSILALRRAWQKKSSSNLGSFSTTKLLLNHSFFLIEKLSKEKKYLFLYLTFSKTQPWPSTLRKYIAFRGPMATGTCLELIIRFKNRSFGETVTNKYVKKLSVKSTWKIYVKVMVAGVV